MSNERAEEEPQGPAMQRSPTTLQQHCRCGGIRGLMGQGQRGMVSLYFKTNLTALYTHLHLQHSHTHTNTYTRTFTLTYTVRYTHLHTYTLYTQAYTHLHADIHTDTS